MKDIRILWGRSCKGLPLIPPDRLTQSAFVLISGRLGAIYGYQRLLFLGGGIMALFSLANGLVTRYDAFIACRAMTGIGGGMIVPNAVALLTTMLPPGQSRNVAMGFFGAAAPLGGWLGAVFSGVFIQYAEWKYMFFAK